MKKILIIFILILSQQIISQTQGEMNDKANIDYVKADNKLNSIYNQILIEYNSDSQFIQNLKKAQRIWIDFRDAEVEMKYPSIDKSEYGSVFPMCRWMYLTELTEMRIIKLDEWINGIEEGDVCMGSTKMKD